MRIAVVAAVAVLTVLAAPAAAQMSTGNGDQMAYVHCLDGHRPTDYRISQCLRARDTGTGHRDDAGYEVIGLYIRQRAFDKALADIDTALARFDYLWAREVRAEVYAMTGRYDDAMADSAKAFDLATDDAWAYANRCEVRAIANRDLDQALTDCNAAIAKHERAPYFADRALVHLRMGKLSEALADCNRAVDLDGRNDTARFLRGVVEHKMGDTAAGDADIGRAQAHDIGIGEAPAAYGVMP